MLELTFGEQVKIVLSRKGMTIKQLAEMIEERTGKKMSRQNLTQRLSRDNFQEQDMRLIASILDCPFHLSILEENSDSEHVVPEKKRREVPTEIMDAEPEQLTLNLEFDEEEPEEVVEPEEAEYAEESAEEVAAQKPGNERDITIGELVDIQEESTADTEPSEDTLEYESRYVDEPAYEDEPEYAEETTYEDEPEYAEETTYEDEPEYAEETAYEDEPEYVEEAAYEGEPEYTDESSYEEQPQENDVSEILEEVAAIEAEEKKAREEKEKEKEQEKPRGWRAYLQRRKKKQVEEVTEKVQEEKHYQEESLPQEEEAYQEQDQYTQENPEYEEYVQESEQEMEEEFADNAGDWEVPEEENVGEINPYTGMEYESNSVRVHPKRIGYVQVYDRSEHQWTDMTEWAFLGYQERKKALLGKDYEPPIYLD